MQPKAPKSSTLTTALAMFSMFFGAGNVVFPLAIGQYAQDKNLFAILGLLITAVGVPIFGLLTMTLFNGNYKHFFERIGKVPGFLVALVIMGLIGPFAAIPRCITLSYSTITMYFPGMNLYYFSFISCILIYLLTFKKNRILDVLGSYLTPLLLVSLGVIIVKGLIFSNEIPTTSHAELDMFLTGLNEGYQTMDLLGAFFFSSVIISCLEQDRVPSDHKNYRHVIFMTLKASAIAGFLLGLIYVGFSYIAAFHSESLAGIEKDQLLGALALQILGPYAGIVAIIAVALACLTTAIALAAVFAEFLHQDVTLTKLPYIPSLAITLIITYFVSTLSFSGIASFLVPILQVCYPALIMLTVLNMAFKLYHFKTVKTPVAIVFLISLFIYFLPS